LGKFYGGTGKIRLNPEVLKNPELFAKVLAHEIGHLIDWLPDKYLQRGNLLGRLLTLRRFLKNTFPLVSETNKELREELIALSEWWKPYDKDKVPERYIKYRRSSVELYADAISVLLNSPTSLEERAPKFFREFFEHLDRKPEVKEAYFGLMEWLTLNPDEIMARRQQRRRLGYAKAYQIAKDMEAERELAKKDILIALRTVFENKMRYIEKKTFHPLKDDVTPPEGHVMHFLEEATQMLNNDAFLLAYDINKEIIEPATKAGLSLADLGEYMELTRIIYERAEIANPGGEIPKTARDGLEYLKRQLGEEKFQILENLIKKFHELIFPHVEEAVRVGAYPLEVFKEKIEPFKYVYATFQVVHHMFENPDVTPMLRMQKGTFGDIRNPFITTLIKTMRLTQLNALQRAKNSIIETWRSQFPDEISDTRVKTLPGGIPKLMTPKPGTKTLHYLKNGKLAGVDVDPYIVDVFELEMPDALERVVAVLGFLNSKFFKPLVLTYNLGFSYFSNIIRDWKRNYQLIPNATVLKLLNAYFKAMPSAWRLAKHGELDQVVREMVENRAYLATFVEYVWDIEQDEFGWILKKFRFIDSDGKVDRNRFFKTLFKPLLIILNFIKVSAQAFEAVGKISGFSLRKAGGETGQRLAYNTRNYTSTPNFRARGWMTPLSNNVVVFSNITIQGIKSSFRMSVNPKTRGGVWFKMAWTVLLPKTIMALALYGLYGDDIKKLMRGISSYDLTNYITIPLGEGPDGKTIYFRLPVDEWERFIAAIYFKLLMAPMERGIKGEEVFAIGEGILPLSVTPFLKVPLYWTLYASNINPYDWFRGRPIIPEQIFKAGRWSLPSLKRMIFWSFNQFGLSSFSTYDDATKTWWETVIEATPLLNRMFRITDYGLQERARSIARDIEQIDAARRVRLKGLSQELEEFYELYRKASISLQLMRFYRERQMLDEAKRVADESPEFILMEDPSLDFDAADRLFSEKMKAIELIEQSQSIPQAKKESMKQKLEQEIIIEARHRVAMAKEALRRHR